MDKESPKQEPNSGLLRSSKTKQCCLSILFSDSLGSMALKSRLTFHTSYLTAYSIPWQTSSIHPKCSVYPWKPSAQLVSLTGELTTIWIVCFGQKFPREQFVLGKMCVFDVSEPKRHKKPQHIHKTQCWQIWEYESSCIQWPCLQSPGQLMSCWVNPEQAVCSTAQTTARERMSRQMLKGVTSHKTRQQDPTQNNIT